MKERKKQDKNGNTRLSIDIPISLHQDITLTSVVRNVTLTRWVQEAIMQQLHREKPVDN